VIGERLQILLVDADPALRREAGRALEEAGYEVRFAAGADEALRTVREKGLPHLAIVEVTLPGPDGLDLCRRLRQGSDLPVVIFTAITEEETAVAALEEVAEEYILKPCQPRVLVAHVRRVLQRLGDFRPSQGRAVTVDDRLAIDFAGCEAVVAGNRIALTRTESKILYILMRSAGRTVAADVLLRRLSPRREMERETLRVHIHNLRLKIEPDIATPRYVFTERGLGYRFRTA